MSHLSHYTPSIFAACVLFIPVAALFTLPFMIYEYRKYGSIPALRVLIIYSFILYMMCAFLLTVLPLPDYDAVLAAKPKGIQYIPFSTWISTARNVGLRFSRPKAFFNPRVWLALLRSSGFFEILANIVMQIPLGIYLRYYFKRTWKQTLLIGFLVTLFYETTQLTGLWFIYPKAYRLCSFDDLFDNTLGTMIGFWITPIFSKILPSRDELDSYSIAHDRRATVMRRITAAAIDWLIYIPLCVFPAAALTDNARSFFTLEGVLYLAWIAVYYVLIQKRFHGRTPGKALLRIRVIDHDKYHTPSVAQYVIRYALIYIAAPITLALYVIIGGLIVSALQSEYEAMNFLGIMSSFIITGTTSRGVLHILKKHHEFPHSFLSRTRIITTARSDRAEALYQRAKAMRAKLRKARTQRHQR